MIIRNAGSEDVGTFLDLVLYASPEYTDIFGNNTNALFENLFIDKGTLFSHEHALIAENEGVPAGFILGYGTKQKKAQELKTGLTMMKMAGGSLLKNLPFLIKHGGDVGKVYPGEYFVSNIAVYPDRRSGGVGAKLLTEFELRAKEAGAEKVALEVSKKNEKGVAFYQRLGYEQQKEFSLTYKGKRKDYFRMIKKI